MRPAFTPFLAALAAVALPAAPHAAAAAAAAAVAPQVTIYRCTDAAGRLTLRDTPCDSGSEQEVRSMQRPKDAPPRPAMVPPEPSATIAAVAPEPRVIVLRAPQPLYECTAPDGNRYTSASDEGNPRWVPLWTLGYPVQAGGNDLALTGGHVRIDHGRVSMARPLPYAPWPATAGTWVRDRCHALPQAEVCDRLRDDRREIDRRFFNAQPSEREILRLERRSVQARLDADCA